MSFIRNVSITLATRCALFVIGLATSIVLARAVGPEGKGILSLAILASAVIFYATNLGIGMGAGYFLGRRKVSLELLTGTWLTLSLLIGLSVLVVAVLVAPYIVPSIMPSVPVWFVQLSLVSVPCLILIYTFQTVFKAMGDFKRFNILDLFQPGSFLILFVLLIYIVPGHKLSAAVSVNASSYIIAAVAVLVLTAGVVRLRFRWSGELARASARFGIQGYLASFLDFLNLRLDLLLVNLFLAPRFVGYYTISVMIAEKLWYVPDVLSVVLYPRVAHGGEEEANRDTAVVSRQTVLIILFGCVGILLVGRPVVRYFYTEQFLPAVIPLFVLLPGILAASVARIISSDLLARGYPRVHLWAGLVALISNVGLN
ncbi:MAG: oligosaccharide flippase family protein, partial [bacterium]